MAAPPPLGGRMILSAWKNLVGQALSPAKVLLPVLLLAASAHATTFYVTISGLGGEPDYDQRFKMWTEDIDGSLKKAGGDAKVFTLQAPTRDKVQAQFAEIARQAKPDDALVVMLI